MSESRPALLQVERLLLATGGILLAVYASARIDSWTSSNAALQQFDSAGTHAEFATEAGEVPLPEAGEIDFSLWSDKRIKEFRASLSLKQDPPLAVLSLARLRIRVPVFAGTDDLTLNRGVGWIDGTAKPGEAANSGIAGHRDGFFRGLKDVEAGDLIELRMPDRVLTYRVSGTEIVSPEDVGVLLPRGVPSLTLVTCYPFYYIGSAPQRFIVHATLQEHTETSR